MMESRFQSLIRGKKVVFITVKNKDYIRVTQVKRLLEKEASSFAIFTSEKGNPITRALDLRRRIPKMDFSDADVIILGFLPQLIIGKVMDCIGRGQDASTPKDSAVGNAAQSADGNAAKFAADSVAQSVVGGPGRQLVVADMFLSLYDTVVLDRKFITDGYPVSLFLRKLDKRVIENSDLVLTDTKANASFLANTYGASAEKFETLYLEADSELYDAARYASGVTDEVDVEKVVEEISSYGIKDKEGNTEGREKGTLDRPFKVLYFGTGLPLQGTDTVLDAFNIAAGDKIKCTYVGGLNGVKSSISKNATINPNIEIINWLSQKELAKKIAEADLCVAGHFNLYIDKAARTIPGKAYIYEAMGKPMILGDTKANHELFTPDEKHIFVKRGNSKELAKAILRACGSAE